MAERRTAETEDHVQANASAVTPLCATVFVETHSFVVELPTRGSVVLGRDAECDLQLGASSVSRQHARLDMRGDQGSLVDLGSRNGTFVNGERVEDDSCRVGRGDELWFGSARMGLIGSALLPSSTHRVLVRSGFLARIDADIARGLPLHALALRLPDRWYAHDDVVAWLPKLPHDAYVGMVSEDVLVVVSGVPLVDAPPPGFVGRASGAGLATGTALVAAALRAATERRTQSEPPGSPIFASPSMIRAHDEAAQIAASTVSVLLSGETGVGKEVFARLIHERSGRTGPLVSVNTAAIPESLVESELFGHEKGAFSGAHQAKIGLIEAANKGTLFLDEIGDLPLPLQAKLLRVLEDRSIRPVGGTQEKRVDVRVVAATHANLERAVEEGTFRRDLFFRLNACTLRIPPLRERRDEIMILANEFAARAARESSPTIIIAPATAEILRTYSWPGNVRELRNVIERGVALANQAGTLMPEHLPDHVRSPRGTNPPPALATGDVRDALKDYERQRILDALDKTGGNRTEAAKILGLPRRTLTYKMGKLNIGRGE
jgi:two-component system, NtrC family, response regulator AtoC